MNNQPHTSPPRSGTDPLLGTVLSTAIVGVSALALFLLGMTKSSAIAPLFLLASVLVGAARFGVLPGIVAALAAFAAYNFLFVEPYYTLRVRHFSDVVALAVFLVTAGLTGWLAGRLKDEADSASRRMDHLNYLANLTRSLALCETTDEVLRSLTDESFTLTSSPLVLLAQRDGSMESLIARPVGSRIDNECLPMASRAFSYQTDQPPAAYGSSGRLFAFYPAGADKDRKFVLAAQFSDVARRFAAEIHGTLKQMTAQTSIGLLRIQRGDEARAARQSAETEKLRSGLLLSLSHDLRTPLSGILGAVSSLREPSLKLSLEAKADLLLTAEQETRRLARYVDDLLALTRLQADLKPNLITCDAREIAATALERAQVSHPSAKFQLDSSATALLIRSDPLLVGQMIFNLLDNAAKHAGDGGYTRLEISRSQGEVKFSVTDDGMGIDPVAAAQIFDPLFRGRDSAGAGLGLAIVKSAATVLGATLELISPVANQKGASFIISFPECQ